jgi:homocysteine S-methyltransferase
MHAAGERGAEVGLEMAHRLLEALAHDVHGTYIMPSFGRYELAAELVRRVRADNRISTSPATSASDLTSARSHH